MTKLNKKLLFYENAQIFNSLLQANKQFRIRCNRSGIHIDAMQLELKGRIQCYAWRSKLYAQLTSLLGSVIANYFIIMVYILWATFFEKVFNLLYT